MEKKLFLAIALSLLILLSWSAFVSKVYHIENKEVTQSNTLPQPQIETKQPSDISVPDKELESSPSLNFKSKNMEVVFSESRAAIKEVIFHSYQSYKFPLLQGFLLDDSSLVFKKEGLFEDSVGFVYSDQEKKISKKFNFSNINYDIVLEIKIKNLTSSALDIKFPLLLGELNLTDSDGQGRFKDFAVAGPEKIAHPNPQKDAVFTSFKFLGLRDRYFCAIIEPADNDRFSGFVKKINGHNSEMGLRLKDTILAPHQEVLLKFHIYLGPQELRVISSIRPDWTIIVNYGTFDFISQFLLQVLGFLFKIVQNWGLAVISLSILIYFLFYPLTLKQMRSMKEMQALQPRIDELRKNYKDNPQRLNKEIMELYREHKVNPFSGCLPLLLQMPIFFALYQALMRSIALKGARFLWINDLSQPDRLFILPFSLPIMGNEINILPVVMTIGMFIQQKMSMTSSTTSGVAEQQKLMLIIMPLMFGLIFYHMPAGLVLYWFINSALMLIYQIKVKSK